VVISKHGFNDSHAPQVPLWKRRSDLKSSPHLPRDRYWGNNVALHRRALLSAVIEDTLPLASVAARRSDERRWIAHSSGR